jgi:hypothetical protein
VTSLTEARRRQTTAARRAARRWVHALPSTGEQVADLRQALARLPRWKSPGAAPAEFSHCSGVAFGAAPTL